MARAEVVLHRQRNALKESAGLAAPQSLVGPGGRSHRSLMVDGEETVKIGFGQRRPGQH